MTAIVVIPARYASTRFPGKIIASRTGRPLVQHVVDRVRSCRRVGRIVVATDDERVRAALAPFGTETVLTAARHASGTDRVAEVARGCRDAIVVNVQGDEPEIEPQAVDALVERLESGGRAMATVATPFPPHADVHDPNRVKVVLGDDGRALYFSRAVIPHARDPGEAPQRLLHLGLYAYRREFLLEYASWPPSSLEQVEKLEQLRALQRGHAIDVVIVPRAMAGVDTPEQYEQFVQRWKQSNQVSHEQ